MPNSIIAKSRILVTWKKTGETQIYSNVKVLIRDFPVLSYDIIMNDISREKQPYEDDSIKVERKEIIF